MTKREYILRKKKMPKTQLARLGDWSYSSVVAWCRGDTRRIPSIQKSEEIASLLNNEITASEIRMIKMADKDLVGG